MSYGRRSYDKERTGATTGSMGWYPDGTKYFVVDTPPSMREVTVPYELTKQLISDVRDKVENGIRNNQPSAYIYKRDIEDLIAEIERLTKLVSQESAP